MNKAHIKLWIDALRSGKYKQGKNLLRRSDGTFCCLGVACMVYQQVTRKGKWERQECAHDLNAQAFNGERASLPKDVQDWYGITRNNLSFRDDGITGNNGATLATLNDRFNWSFEQIADYIEERMNFDV